MALKKEINAGLELHNKGDFHGAIQYFLDTINQKKGSGEKPSLSELQNIAASFYATNDYKMALHFLKEAHKQDPENVVIRRNLGHLYTKIGAYETAIENLEIFLKHYPDDFIAYDALTSVYLRSSRKEDALESGKKSLEIKSRIACSEKNLSYLQETTEFKWQINRVPIPPFNNKTLGYNIISYSLWGNNPKYIDGAIRNSIVAPVVFPAWICRFYCDESVPENVRQELQDNGAQVIMMPKMESAYYGLFWRFNVINDQSVQRYLIRDADSPLTCQERIAVDEWIESERYFHLIRDHRGHTELIHAGLWGGVQGALPEIETVYDEFYRNASKERTIDQQFLRMYVWPLIKDYHLAHDTYYKFGNAVSFSVKGKNMTCMHVGQNWAGMGCRFRSNS